MSQPAPTDQISRLLAGYVLGTLDAAEAEAFAQLIIEKPSLIEQVDQMQQALENAYNLPELVPPPQLKEKVLAAITTVEHSIAPEAAKLKPAVSKPADWSTSTHQQSSRRLKAIALALFAALGISTILNYMLWRQLKQQIATPPDIQQEETISSVAYILSTTELSTSGTAEVIINQDTLTALLKTSQLPALAPDETYVLWTVLTPEAPYTTDEKDAILTTAFRVDEQGNARETLAIPSAFQQPGLIKAIAITVESAVAPQEHTGSPILFTPI